MWCEREMRRYQNDYGKEVRLCWKGREECSGNEQVTLSRVYSGVVARITGEDTSGGRIGMTLTLMGKTET